MAKASIKYKTVSYTNTKTGSGASTAKKRANSKKKSANSKKK